MQLMHRLIRPSRLAVFHGQPVQKVRRARILLFPERNRSAQQQEPQSQRKAPHRWTPVKRIPWRKNRWLKMNSSTIGSIATSDPAINSGQFGLENWYSSWK